MTLLVQFLLRLTCGLTVGMALASPRLVSSGYFRNHLYVALGLSTLAGLLCFSEAPEVAYFAIGAAIMSYVASVFWLYEKDGVGRGALLVVSLLCLTGLCAQLQQEQVRSSGEDRAFMAKYFSTPADESPVSAAEAHLLDQRARKLGYLSGSLTVIGTVSSSLLLGITMATMLLGHWYLNSPTMELAPLRRLILAMGLAVALQMLVSAAGLWGEVSVAHHLSKQWILFVVLRWSFGLIGVLILTWMAWQTLKIPNTQSATGILYVAVIGTFVGETMSLLLSTESMFPL